MTSYVFVRRSNNFYPCLPAFLQTMCTPSGNTGNAKSSKIPRNTKHSIYKKTTVKSTFATNRFITQMCFHNPNLLDTSFHCFIQMKFIHFTFCLRQFFCIAFQNHGTRVRQCINRMSHSINQTGFIKRYLDSEFYSNIL